MVKNLCIYAHVNNYYYVCMCPRVQQIRAIVDGEPRAQEVCCHQPYGSWRVLLQCVCVCVLLGS